jgi:hypothetical protein
MSADVRAPTPRRHTGAPGRDRVEPGRTDDATSREDLADAEWLYAWSLEEVSPTWGSLAQDLVELG